MYFFVVLFSFSLTVSVDRLKDVTTCGNKKVSSEDLRFDTRIKGLLKDYLGIRDDYDMQRFLSSVHDCLSYLSLYYSSHVIFQNSNPAESQSL